MKDMKPRKEELISWINKIDNESVLSAIEQLKSVVQGTHWKDNLTKEEKLQ